MEDEDKTASQYQIGKESGEEARGPGSCLNPGEVMMDVY